ncbi:520_t:CDS:2 [Ambispora gerdemannii]|uniref:520_t:CDS:1 n=1 Tax=Ambispora gerdemannii TaxID=144530 RepID=A0A9N8V325_9GLOM|nr:520_t:CDS:2 [Ambispora gerdemannii]
MNSKGLNYINSFPTNEQYDAKTCSCRQLVLQEDWEDHQVVCSERRLICPAYLAFLNFQSEQQEYYECSLTVVDSNCPISLKELAKIRILENINGNLDSILSAGELPFSIMHTLSYECPTFGSLNALSEHVTRSCPYWKVNCLVKTQYFLIRPEDLFYRDWHWQMHEVTPSPCVNTGLSRCNFLEVHSKAVSLDPISHKLKPIQFLYPFYCSSCEHYFPENTTKHLCARPTSSFSLSPPSRTIIVCQGCKKPLKNPRKSGTYQQLENNCTLCVHKELDPISHKLKPIHRTYQQLENNCTSCINKNQVIRIIESPPPLIPSDNLGSIVLCQACKNPLIKPRGSSGGNGGYRQVENNCIYCDSGSMIIFLPGLGSYFPPSSRQNRNNSSLYSDCLVNQRSNWQDIKGKLMNKKKS